MKCLGIDIGGTFTDLIIVDDENNSIYVEKVSSTPKNQSIGVKNGLKRFNTLLTDLNVVVHGTTVATNAILERKGAKSVLITTAGFEDILEIGRQNRSNLYSLCPKRIEPLIPKELRYGVKERLNSSGEIQIPLDFKSLNQIINQIKNEKSESIAISLLFSFFNPIHEIMIRDEIKKQIPNINVSWSSFIFPVFREYDRTSITVLDAYIAPLMRNYFNSFLTKIEENGIKVPPLVLLSTGGVTQIQNAADRSVETILSGLAGGVLGGLYSCNKLNTKDALTLDIGGTSTDVASIVEGKIEISTDNKISGFPIHIPTIAVQTIGAGGGSIAQLDHGLLNVGPESAGADPGPACYNKGGALPTVTDANLILGMLNPDYFCGGTLKIYPHLARKVISSISNELNFSSLEECAAGIIEIFENNIALALRKVSTEKGYDSRNFSLIAFGGAGPLHGCSLANRLMMDQVVIPPYPGVWSAFGLLTADIRHDLSISILKSLETVSKEDLEAGFRKLSQQGIQLCLDDGFSENEVIIERQLDIRLIGQSYELMIPYYETKEAISHAFDKSHEKVYGYASPDEPREIVNLRIAAVVPLPKFELTKFTKGNRRPEGESISDKRNIFINGEWIEALIYQKSKLRAKNVIYGPSIIEQNDSTTLINNDWFAEIKTDGHILLRRMKDK